MDSKNRHNDASRAYLSKRTLIIKYLFFLRDASRSSFVIRFPEARRHTASIFTRLYSCPLPTSSTCRSTFHNPPYSQCPIEDLSEDAVGDPVPDPEVTRDLQASDEVVEAAAAGASHTVSTAVAPLHLLIKLLAKMEQPPPKDSKRSRFTMRLMKRLGFGGLRV